MPAGSLRVPRPLRSEFPDRPPRPGRRARLRARLRLRPRPASPRDRGARPPCPSLALEPERESVDGRRVVERLQRPHEREPLDLDVLVLVELGGLGLAEAARLE